MPQRRGGLPPPDPVLVPRHKIPGGTDPIFKNALHPHASLSLAPAVGVALLYPETARGHSGTWARYSSLPSPPLACRESATSARIRALAHHGRFSISYAWAAEARSATNPGLPARHRTKGSRKSPPRIVHGSPEHQFLLREDAGVLLAVPPACFMT